MVTSGYVKFVFTVKIPEFLLKPVKHVTTEGAKTMQHMDQKWSNVVSLKHIQTNL